MAAIQPSLLTIDGPSRRPHAANERKETDEVDKRDDKHAKRIDDDDQQKVGAATEPLTGFLKIFAGELTVEQPAQSGIELPLTDQALPTEHSETSVDSELDEALAAEASDPTLLAQAPDSEAIPVSEEGVIAINPTLAKAIQGQVNKQGQPELVVKSTTSDKTTPTVSEQQSSTDLDGLFFNPSESKTLDSKPGGLAMLESQRVQQGAVVMDDGLTALRNITQNAANAAPATPSNPMNTSAALDMAAQAAPERSDSMLLQLQGKTQEFPAKFTQQVAFIVGRGLQQAMIRLDPPELGRIEVKIQKEDERVQVQVVTQSPQARELVERNIHQLKELFAEQGMQLTDADIQHNDSGQSNEQAQANDQRMLGDDGEADGPEMPITRVSQQLLDTYA